jgi:hypothetical protein
MRLGERAARHPPVEEVDIVDIQKIARPPETGVEPAPLDIIAHFKCVNKLNKLFYYPRKRGL